MSRQAVAGLCVPLVLAVAGCAGTEPAPEVKLPTRATAAPSAEATAEPDLDAPSVAPGGALPTVGLPTEAIAELRGAGDLDPSVRAAWTDYQEALSESLRAHRPTAELQAVAGPQVIQMVQDRGPRDAADGLTVSLRPLGRLESQRTSNGVARLTTCLWAPSVGFFVEANGEEAEGAGPGWVEYSTVLTGGGDRWTVTQDERTGRDCTGGAP